MVEWLRKKVSRLPMRVLGLLLLTMAITVSSCQALFPRSRGDQPRQFNPGFPTSNQL
jgi:hypothetical protein